MTTENKYIENFYYDNSDEDEKSEESNISVKSSAILFNVFCWIIVLVAIGRIVYLFMNRLESGYNWREIVKAIMLFILSLVGGIISAILAGAKEADNVVQLAATAGTLTGSSVIWCITIFLFKNCTFRTGKTIKNKVKEKIKQKLNNSQQQQQQQQQKQQQ